MNAAHLHLIINHFPVVGTFMAFLVLLIGWLGKKTAVQKTALLLFVFIGLVSIPVYLSGTGAEEIIEKFPGISEQAIEEHEESATVTLIFIELLAVASLIGFALFGRRENLPAGFLLTVAILSISVVILTAKTSDLGGKIHHAREMGNLPPSTGETVSEEKH